MNETQARREYELIYVLRPQAGRAGSEKISTRVSELIKSGDGRLTQVENWGRRRLAFQVNKQNFGVYYYLKYLGTGALVSELERNLRLSDDVMKFQTVKVSDVSESADVKPEDIEFEHHEAMEDEPIESKAAGLGLDESRHRDGGRSERMADGDDDGADEGDGADASESDGSDEEGEES